MESYSKNFHTWLYAVCEAVLKLYKCLKYMFLEPV